mgnify:CR=1 FL=1
MEGNRALYGDRKPAPAALSDGNQHAHANATTHGYHYFNANPHNNSHTAAADLDTGSLRYPLAFSDADTVIK